MERVGHGGQIWQMETGTGYGLEPRQEGTGGLSHLWAAYRLQSAAVIDPGGVGT